MIDAPPARKAAPPADRAGHGAGAEGAPREEVAMEMDNEALHRTRFLSLVLSLHGSAWAAMGKVANPMTGKVERDLEAARGSIDLLETLKVKTRGNLSREEEKTLANALGVLQLNYVDEAARGEQGKKPGGGEPGAPGGGAPGSGAAEAEPPGAADGA